MIDSSNGVTINGAKVIKADIVARNGVIHVIDTVLLPGKHWFDRYQARPRATLLRGRVLWDAWEVAVAICGGRAKSIRRDGSATGS